MSELMNQPRVGVAVLIQQENKLLLSRRSNSPEQGYWQCAGGYLKSGETVSECALRCVAETGVRVSIVEAGPYTNNVFAGAAIHSVTLYVLARYCDGVAHESWQWYDWQQLPQPLFLPLNLLFKDNREWVLNHLGSR